MKSIIDLTNQRFGRYLVIKVHGRDKYNRALWECLCDCGSVRIVYSSNLRKGSSKSCGCLNREKVLNSTIKHRMTNTRPYFIWKNMKNRCSNSNLESFSNYGRRGITVCERWLDNFENFWNDMKNTYKEGLTLDRIDNNKGYYKENCQWATRLQQGNNKRNNIVITFNNKTQTLPEWARELNIPYKRLMRRLQLGWSINKALSTI